MQQLRCVKPFGEHVPGDIVEAADGDCNDYFEPVAATDLTNPIVPPVS